MGQSPVSANDFQQAANAAQARCGEAKWTTMSVREQGTAIYAELQRIDAERVKAAAKSRRGQGADGR